MANSFSNMTDTIIVQNAINAFTAAITPLNAFLTDFSSAAVQRGDKVKVPFVLAADAAEDFGGTYTMQDADAEGIDITINKHKFVSWSLTDTEVATQPQLSVELFGQQKGFQLAKAVLQDIWSLITAANFGSAGLTSTSGNFDLDDVADLAGTCDTADWAENLRGLVLSSAYYTALTKDSNLQSVNQAGTDQVQRRNVLPMVHGFTPYKSTLVPGNSENLTGFACRPEAIIAAMRYLAPQAGHDYADAGPVSTPEGITLGFRSWYDRDLGRSKRVLECNYGYTKGLGSALKRIVSS